MAEGNARRRREPRGPRLEPATKFARSGIAHRGDVLGQEIHLLREPALDDRVVLVEPERQRLAIKDLLADLRVDEILQLLDVRRGTPLGPPRYGHLVQVVVGQRDACRRVTYVLDRYQHPVSDEQEKRRTEKVQQGLAKPAVETRVRRVPDHGLLDPRRLDFVVRV